MKAFVLLCLTLFCVFQFTQVHAQAANYPNQAQTFVIGRQNYALWWAGALIQGARYNGTGPLPGVRAFAIATLSIQETVNSYTQLYKFYLQNVSAPANSDLDGAVSGAGFAALSAVYPNQIYQWTIIYKTQIALLKRASNRNFNGVSDRAIAAGSAWGVNVAKRVVAARANDGANSDLYVPYNVPPGPGVWNPTPPNYATAPPEGGRWGQVTPFVVLSSSQFLPPGPPFRYPDLYTIEYNEVLVKGEFNSTGKGRRTAQETFQAVFWSAEGYGESTPPGLYLDIVTQIAVAANLDIVNSARLLALTSFAIFDASITAWNAKYFYNHWRPISAIVNNTNASLTTVSNWVPLLTPTPPFPDYVSGHSTFGGAVATILQNFFNTDTYTYQVTSDSLPGVTATYHTFSQFATDNAFARVWGGVNFRKSCQDGVNAGYQVGQYVFANAFTPVL